MRFAAVLAIVAALGAASCSTGNQGILRADAQLAEAGDGSSGEIAQVSGSPAPVLPPTTGLARDLFATSPRCGQCHDSAAGASANLDEKGRSVGLFSLWGASAMGNSARDPLFRTALANENSPAVIPVAGRSCT